MSGEVPVGYLVLMLLGLVATLFEVPGGPRLFAEGAEGLLAETFARMHLGSADILNVPQGDRARLLRYRPDGWSEWCWHGYMWLLPPHGNSEVLCVSDGSLHWCNSE